MIICPSVLFFLFVVQIICLFSLREKYDFLTQKLFFYGLNHLCIVWSFILLFTQLTIMYSTIYHFLRTGLSTEIQGHVFFALRKFPLDCRLSDVPLGSPCILLERCHSCDYVSLKLMVTFLLFLQGPSEMHCSSLLPMPWTRQVASSPSSPLTHRGHTGRVLLECLQVDKMP